MYRSYLFKFLSLEIGLNKLFYILPLCLLLPACAPVLKSHEMMPKMQAYDGISSSKMLNKNISVSSVVVKKGLGGMVAPITDAEYRDALVSALRLSGWYGGDTGKYRLDANLLEVDQPYIGFNFTVTAKAEYTLTDKKTGKVRYHDILTLPCTVTMAEAFVGEVRLRNATSCAVGENITHLLKVLDQRF